MAMRGETEHSVVLKADEVELGSTDRAVDLEVVLGLMLQFHSLQVPNLKAIALFRYDQEQVTCQVLDELGFVRENCDTGCWLEHNESVEVFLYHIAMSELVFIE